MKVAPAVARPDGRSLHHPYDVEVHMRAILPVALVLALAGGAHAQSAPAQNATGGDAAVEARLAPVQTPAPAVQLQQTTGDVKPIQAADRQVADNVNTVVAEEAVRQDPTTRRWWWLVGAIVVAGVVLAVIL
jgi:hypothetical protein